MDLQLEGKTALVTGASSQGIGRAIALGLAAEGAIVEITARRVELLGKTAREFVAAGYREPIVLEADLYAEETPHALAAAAADAFSRVDILINCAGGSRPPPPVDGGLMRFAFSSGRLSRVLFQEPAA